MSLDFMVVGAPRSGTTWVANWLNAGKIRCHHDPLGQWKPGQLDAHLAERGMIVGVACTGLALFPEFVNKHPAKKLVLVRNLDEVDESLANVGAGKCRDKWEGVLERLDGGIMRLPWRYVFDPRWAGKIHTYLTGEPGDPVRHAMLVEMYVAPRFPALRLNRGNVRELMQELRGLSDVEKEDGC